jgi:hypothetical protein
VEGRRQDVGTAGPPPVVRVAGIDVDSARRLAAKVQSQLGSSALGTVNKSGATWSLDLIVRADSECQHLRSGASRQGNRARPGHPGWTDLRRGFRE